MEPTKSVQEHKADVVIVGAGPAGVVTAYLLARSGISTVLVERHQKLDREFRGYFFQPLVVKLFDQMGVMDELLQLKHSRIDAFHFLDKGKTLFSVRFDDLAKPYDFGLLMQQPLLLQYFIDKANELGTFTYLKGTTARELVRENGAVTGIRLKQDEQEILVRTRLVVGADGRHSTVRKLAAIPLEDDPIPFDFLWFDMPEAPGISFPLQIAIEDSGMLIYIPKGEGMVQVGWVIEKSTYGALRKNGIDAFREQILSVAPELRAHLTAHLTDFKQVSVLDIQVAMAKHWVEDGLLLIGDAAHIASPFSGQGNSLAIQDAVVAHDLIAQALSKGSSGALAASELQAFEQIRRPAVAAIQRIQRMQAGLIGIKNPLLLQARRSLMPLVRRTPIFRVMRNKLALGPQPVRVETRHFRR